MLKHILKKKEWGPHATIFNKKNIYDNHEKSIEICAARIINSAERQTETSLLAEYLRSS